MIKLIILNSQINAGSYEIELNVNKSYDYNFKSRLEAKTANLIIILSPASKVICCSNNSSMLSIL